MKSPQLDKIDLNRMLLFKMVVEVGSFSKASALLHVPKSNVSRNISSLEQELGIQLIYRTTRQFQLTEAGRKFYESIREPLLSLESSVGKMGEHSQEISGLIRMTAPEDMSGPLLAQILEEFMRLHPHIQIECILTNERMDLVKNSIDLGLRIGTPRDSTMLHRKVGRVPMVLVASPGFADRHMSSLTIDKISNIPAIGFTILKPHDRWTLISRKGPQRVKINPVFSSDNFLLVKEMAIHGVGLALIPHFLCHEELRLGQLQQVMKEWTAGPGEGGIVHLIMPQQKEPSRKLKAFIQFLQERLKPHFAPL